MSFVEYVHAQCARTLENDRRRTSRSLQHWLSFVQCIPHECPEMSPDDGVQWHLSPTLFCVCVSSCECVNNWYSVVQQSKWTRPILLWQRCFLPHQCVAARNFWYSNQSLVNIHTLRSTTWWKTWWACTYMPWQNALSPEKAWHMKPGARCTQIHANPVKHC